MDDYKTNRQIIAESVRLISDETQEVVSLKIALQRAFDADLDLVEVVPTANPPVCKIIDYNKFRYELQKKEKEQNKKQRESKVDLKELWIRPVTSDHDVDVKVKNASSFLQQGHKVKFTMKFRGREIAHLDQGLLIFDAIISKLGNVTIEQPAKRNGKTMIMIVSPGK